MLTGLQEYHRPKTIKDAVALLWRPEHTTRAIAGGTSLTISWRPSLAALVDLGHLPLNYVKVDKTNLLIGATNTLQDLVEHPDLATFANGVLVETAEMMGGRNLRNAATLGGTLAVATGRDPLLLALMALDAKLTVYAPAARQTPLEGFLTYREKLLVDGALITQVSLPLLIGPLGAAFAGVGRTPRDLPIVCALARMELAQGVAANVRLALGGVGRLPQRAYESERLLERKPLTDERIAEAAAKAIEGLEPSSDYRASGVYRREMAQVLARRVLSAAAARAQV